MSNDNCKKELAIEQGKTLCPILSSHLNLVLDGTAARFYLSLSSCFYHGRVRYALVPNQEAHVQLMLTLTPSCVSELMMHEGLERLRACKHLDLFVRVKHGLCVRP